MYKNEGPNDSVFENEDQTNLESAKEKIARLRLLLKDDCRNYSKRLELLKLLRENGDIEELRSERTKITENFLLTEEFWIEWLEDEQFITNFDNSNKFALCIDDFTALYSRAVQDYMSVPLYISWIEFLNNLIVKYIERKADDKSNFSQSSASEDEVQFNHLKNTLLTVLENAVTNLYGEMNDVVIIWKCYRDFQAQLGDYYGKHDLEQKKLYIKNIRLLFIREFENPHLQVLNIYECEYVPWESSVRELMPPNLEESFYISKLIESAKVILLQRAVFEEQINNSDSDHLSISTWKEYLKFEFENVERSLFLYERAIKQSDSQQFWILYCFYLLEAFMNKISIKFANLSLAELIKNVFMRVTKKHPENCLFWCLRIAALELLNEEELMIDRIFDLSISNNSVSQNEVIMIHKQYLDYKMRLILNSPNEECVKKFSLAIQNSIKHFDQHLPLSAPEVYAYAANLELELKNTKNAINLYESMLTRYGYVGSAWTEYIAWAAKNMSSEDLVKLINRAINETAIQPELVWKASMDAVRLVKHGLGEYIRVWKACIEKHQQITSNLENQSKKRFLHTEEDANNSLEVKKSRYQVDENAVQIISDNNKNLISNHTTANSSIKSVEKDGSIFKMREQTASTSLVLDTVTLHVMGIPSVGVEERMLRPIFEEFGNVKEIRLICTENGQVKNYFFVTFESSAGSKAVIQAVKNGQKFSVVCDGSVYPLKVTRAFALPETINSEFKTRIFVSNISPLTSDLSLEMLFKQKQIPTPISLRRPKNKFGEYRNFAYLEYQNEAEVKEACKLLNNLLIDGRVLKASPSNPKKSRMPIKEGTSEVQESTSITKAVPRSVQRKKLVL